MRRKISAILVTVLIMLMVMPMGAFAAVPSVQEVEALIAQIGTVTRDSHAREPQCSRKGCQCL